LKHPRKSLSFLFASVPKPVFLSITVLGVSATITQVVLMREFLSVVSGNELVIGIILGNWLFLTGLGALAGKKSGRVKSPVELLAWAQLALALFPPLSLLVVRYGKTALFPIGETVGVLEVFLLSGAVLAPYCLLSGLIQPLACVLFSRTGEENRIGEVYFLDVLGDILGGLLFSLVLIHWFRDLTITFFLCLLNLFAVGVLIFGGGDPPWRKAKPAVVTIFLFAGMTSLLIFGNLNTRSIQGMFPGQEVLSSAETPYGLLVATRTRGQINIFENGLPMYSSQVTIQAEENVHYAMLQHPAPKRILLVSGGTGPVFREIAKYRVQSVDYVELDPTVVEWNRKFGGLRESPGIRVIHQDGRRFIKRTETRYDVVLLCLPEADTAALNRYFTVEFYEEVKRILKPNGVLGFGSIPMANYLDRESAMLLSVQFHSLKKVFPHVAFIPGSRVFFVAGNSPVTADILSLLAKHPERKGHFLRPEVLKGFLTPDRIRLVQQALKGEWRLNQDLFPAAYLYQLLRWLKIFQENSVWLAIGLGVLLVLFVVRLRPETFVMFTSGFTGSSLSVVLILMFQAMQGYVYSMIALLITAFMIGMAGGAFAVNRRVAPSACRLLQRLEWGMILFTVLLPSAMSMMVSAPDPRVQSLLSALGVPSLLVVLGGLVGMEFAVIGGMIKEKIADTAGQVYSADYFGAAMGAVLASVFLIPVLGYFRLSFAVGLLHLVSLAVLVKGTRGIPLGKAALLLVYAGLCGYLILGKYTGEKVYVLSYHPVYIWSLVLFLLTGSVVILFWKEQFRDPVPRRTFRVLSVLAFIPLIFFPVYKCWFIIPYLYCHVCPRKCIFGYMRPFTVPMTCLQNLHRRFWCYQLCPVGMLQDAQCAKGRPVRPEIRKRVRFGVLSLVILTYFWVKEAKRHPAIGPGSDLFLFLFTNQYAFSASIFAGVVLVLLVSFRIKRFFCDFLCPIGIFGALTTRWERSLAGRWPWWKKTVGHGYNE